MTPENETKSLTGSDELVAQSKPLTPEVREALLVGFDLMKIIQIANRTDDGKTFTAAMKATEETWIGLIVEQYPGFPDGAGSVLHKTTGTYATEAGAKAAAGQIVQACQEEVASRLAEKKEPKEDKLKPVFLTTEQLENGVAVPREIAVEAVRLYQADKLFAGAVGTGGGYYRAVVGEDFPDRVGGLVLTSFAINDKDQAGEIALKIFAHCYAVAFRGE